MPNVIANEFKQLVKETISSKFPQKRRRKLRRQSRRKKPSCRQNSARRQNSSRDRTNRRDRIHRSRSKQNRNPTYSELKNKLRFLKWCRIG